MNGKGTKRPPHRTGTTMTTNIERADEVITEAFDTAMSSDTRSTWAYQIAQALADAGLLMPNFPEQDEDGEYPAGELYVSREYGSIDIFRYPAVRIASLMPFEVDGLIAALAAANYAEQEQSNGI